MKMKIIMIFIFSVIRSSLTCNRCQMTAYIEILGAAWRTCVQTCAAFAERHMPDLAHLRPTSEHILEKDLIGNTIAIHTWLFLIDLKKSN